MLGIGGYVCVAVYVMAKGSVPYKLLRDRTRGHGGLLWHLEEVVCGFKTDLASWECIPNPMHSLRFSFIQLHSFVRFHV